MNMVSTVQEDMCVMLSRHLNIDTNGANNIVTLIENVIRMCLQKKIGFVDEADVERVRKIILCDLERKPSRIVPDYDLDKCSIQTFIIVVTREITVSYIRNAHYPSSSVSSIFESMNVNVEGAREELDALDAIFTPSQRCVLRLRYGEGCNVIQIANMLGVSTSEVRSVEWQAMQNLQRQFIAMRQSMAPRNIVSTVGQA
ncbi:hypothetical protein JCM15519_01870 [Fundidesulfovibrio butyratiphilus]